MPPFSRRWPPITSVALLLCLLSLVDLWDFGESMAGMDVYAAWTMAQNAGRTDLPNPYARSSQDQMAEEMALRLGLAGRPPRLEAAVEAADPLHLTATPFLYTVFRPSPKAHRPNPPSTLRPSRIVGADRDNLWQRLGRRAEPDPGDPNRRSRSGRMKGSRLHPYLRTLPHEALCATRWVGIVP